MPRDRAEICADLVGHLDATIKTQLAPVYVVRDFFLFFDY